MHVRAQVLKDLRPDGFKYSVTGQDTVAKRCKANGANGKQTITVVNNTCMQAPGPLNFAALYAFGWKHEECHLSIMRIKFPQVSNARTTLEKVVRSDSIAFLLDAVGGTGGFFEANRDLAQASQIIDTPNPDTYTFWSRDPADTMWVHRPYRPNAIIAPGCI
jgi:hypothetical protein